MGLEFGLEFGDAAAVMVLQERTEWAASASTEGANTKGHSLPNDQNEKTGDQKEMVWISEMKAQLIARWEGRNSWRIKKLVME